MAATTTSTPVKRSWADIVKGSSSSPPLEPEAFLTTLSRELEPKCAEQPTLRPAMRGERRCRCQGEILVMLGHYGWIMTFDEIDHPDVGKTAGRVYVHKRDVVKGASLAQGDIVSFYLYVDDQGLGAERCQLEQQGGSGANTDEFVPAVDGYRMAEANEFVPGSCPPPSMNVYADEFVPGGLNVYADEFVPAAPVNTSGCFNAHAAEFVPSKVSSIESGMQDFVPAVDWSSNFGPNSNPHAVTINPAFLDMLSDDESDDESSTVSNDDFSGIDADNEIGDKDSTCTESVQSFQHEEDVEWSSDLDAVVLHAPLKSPRASSVDDSTSVGASGSETEDATPVAVRGFRPPPGFQSLPKGFRPPPGLSLPVLAA